MPQDVGYKLVTIKGKQVALPGDMSDEEVLAYKQEQEGGAVAAQPAGPVLNSKDERDLDLEQSVPVFTGYGTGSVSPNQLLDALPAVGGTLGTILSGGNVGLGALAAGGGESVRQLLRRAMGAHGAPGIAQRALGLDPDSPEAAAAGIGAEGLASTGINLASKGIGALARWLPVQARASAAKALGFSKAPDAAAAAEEVVPYLMGREGQLVSEEGKAISPNIFKPFQSNAPEALAQRAEALSDTAKGVKERALAGKLGNTQLNPAQVESDTLAQIEKLTQGHSKGMTSADAPISATKDAIERFKALLAEDAEKAGAGDVVEKVVGTKVIRLPNGDLGIEDVTTQQFVPDPEWMPARIAEKLRSMADAGYKQGVEAVTPGARDASSRVGNSLRGQLNTIAPVASANKAIHAATTVNKTLTDVLNASNVAGYSPALASGVASAASGNAVRGAALAGGSSLLRNAGVSGQTAALLEALAKRTVPLRSASNNYALLEMIRQLGNQE